MITGSVTVGARSTKQSDFNGVVIKQLYTAGFVAQNERNWPSIFIRVCMEITARMKKYQFSFFITFSILQLFSFCANKQIRPYFLHTEH